MATHPQRYLSVLLPCALIATAACGGDDGPSDAEQACLDTADRFGDLCVRCGVDTYQACRDAIVQGVNGDCANVVQIRDIDELYMQCLPFFETVACSVVTTPGFMIDSSCNGQLLHN